MRVQTSDGRTLPAGGASPALHGVRRASVAWPGHWIIAVVLFSVGLMWVVEASADQQDVRLDGLFAKLRNGSDPQAVADIERQIWAIWSEVEDEEANRAMLAGAQALRAHDWPLAIAAFTRVVEIAPGFAEGWNKRATVYYLADRLDESVRDIQMTLSLEPRHFGALAGMGLIFIETGDYAGALAAFEAVLKVHPQSPAARQRVGELRKRLNGGAV